MNSGMINVDFDKLYDCISQMKSLKKQLEEPSYSKLEFYTNGKSGSGYVQDNLSSFAKHTVDYYESVKKLMNNTISYLESVSALQETDEKAASEIKGK